MRKLALAAMLLSTSAQADTLQIVLGSTISTYTGTVEQLNLDGQNGGVEFTVQRYSTSTTEDIFADGFEGGRGTWYIELHTPDVAYALHCCPWVSMLRAGDSLINLVCSQ